MRGFNIRVGGCSSLLIEREAVEEVGGFDERFPRHQDWELMVRLLEYGSIEVVEEPLFSKIGYKEPEAKKISEAKKLYIKNSMRKLIRYLRTGKKEFTEIIIQKSLRASSRKAGI